MFCKTTYYALVLMMEVALVYESGEGVDFVMHKHAIPKEEFDLVVQKLNETKLLTMVDGRLHLRVPPNKITIWQIVSKVSDDNIFTGRYYDQNRPIKPTSAMTMIHKEREMMLKIIENRLSKQKLSAWSEKASKTIYI